MASSALHAWRAKFWRHSRVFLCLSDRLQLHAPGEERRPGLSRRVQRVWHQHADPRIETASVARYPPSQESIHLVQSQEFGAAQLDGSAEHTDPTIRIWTEPDHQHHNERDASAANGPSLLPKAELNRLRLHLPGMESANDWCLHNPNWPVYA